MDIAKIWNSNCALNSITDELRLEEFAKTSINPV